MLLARLAPRLLRAGPAAGEAGAGGGARGRGGRARGRGCRGARGSGGRGGRRGPRAALLPGQRHSPPAGCVRPRLALRGLPGPVCVAPYSAPPTGNRAAVSGPGKGLRLELEDMLVPRKMSISPLESWLTARCLLPGLHAEAPGSVPPPPLYECPTGQTGSGAGREGPAAWDSPSLRCRNVLKIRRRKMNHHKYRKLVKRTRFLRRKVREGRLRQKQVKFERDLRRVWQKAGLKEAPPGWQTPKIYLKGK
ncbi:Aurora kinase A-interacting protein [Galemys pyrenaicus]|uniref:Small ribosomal subunit protein mS38 n=1 Tax=Galemys pyrenaicus TaxID=202257 RepID=A0A8J6DEJ8_GALPY|nr:Aurora kinase A-interacting protein [Galemys pyrenaicus]